jgi:predicted short-subunit dehydrogenase-like oxidoreductase (DUF2520 family)
MLPAMVTKPLIAIVGPGRLGSALAVELARARYRIAELVSPGGSRSAKRAQALARKLRARASFHDNAILDAELIWFCVPDREIAVAARALASAVEWDGKIALHSSGALPSSELDVLRQRGASVASVHPMMSFVRGAVPSLNSVPFALEGDIRAVRMAQRIAHDLGGEPFHIHAKDKIAYHAWGAFASPLLIALLVSAEQVARAAGQSAADARKKMLPILKQTLENYDRLGPTGAFSGPLVRGDAEIVRRHLQVLKRIPNAKDVYLALSRMAVRYLPVQQRRKMEQLLRSIRNRKRETGNQKP